MKQSLAQEPSEAHELGAVEPSEVQELGAIQQTLKAVCLVAALVDNQQGSIENIFYLSHDYYIPHTGMWSRGGGPPSLLALPRLSCLLHPVLEPGG